MHPHTMKMTSIAAPKPATRNTVLSHTQTQTSMLRLNARFVSNIASSMNECAIRGWTERPLPPPVLNSRWAEIKEREKERAWVVKENERKENERKEKEREEKEREENERKEKERKRQEREEKEREQEKEMALLHAHPQWFILVADTDQDCELAVSLRRRHDEQVYQHLLAEAEDFN